MLSSNLIDQYKQMGLSADAARQRISRARADLRYLSGLSFPKRARFLYLSDHFRKPVYWEALYRVVKKHSPAYGTALVGLEIRDGIYPQNYLPIILGAPVRQQGQIASSVILERLEAIDILKVVSFDGLGECVYISENGIFPCPQLTKLRSRLITENVLLDAIKRWAGRMNIASPEATTTRAPSTLPKFGTCHFDLCGPSYLNPLVEFNNNKIQPGFFVSDVVLGVTLDINGIRPFTRKCAMLKALRNLPKFLPMLVADNFTPEALRECRSQGIIATRPDTIFGKDVAEALTSLLDTLNNSAAIAAVNPDRIEKLFSGISKIEGAASNLRGALFELIVGHCVRTLEAGSIDLGIQVYDNINGKNAEVDVRLVKERDVIIYECKGYQPSSKVSFDEINEWITKKIPTIYSATRQESRFDGTIRFEFWTCGKFHADAIELLAKTKSSVKKYELDWKDGSQVKKYSSRIRASGIKRILNEHFFKHPLKL
ncbi:hypothetical protein [Maridesulfovibrio sp.]|uniref:hypothetical protein n=1 Tax=Maridesulfovibrio sp. TaxID=2795000 RepID=UPI002A18DE67|nr:hypothetical protein [Maridesulfovibrio sp.]